MQADIQRRKSIALMVLCAMLWSTGGIFIKLISWNPLLISGFRSLISLFVMGAYMALVRNRIIINRYSVLAGLGLAGCVTLFVVANKLTTAANAIVLQYTAPVFILIISALFLKKKLRRADIIVVFVAMVGIALFFFDQLSHDGLLGNIVAIISGVCFAVMFVMTGLAGDNDSLRASGMLLGHGFTAIVGCGALFFTEFSPEPMEIFYVFMLGFFQLGLAYVCLTVASKRCPPLACSLIGMLEPLFNPVWVFLFVHETPGFFALCGGAVVLVSISVWFVWDSKPHNDIQTDTDIAI